MSNGLGTPYHVSALYTLSYDHYIRYRVLRRDSGIGAGLVAASDARTFEHQLAVERDIQPPFDCGTQCCSGLLPYGPVITMPWPSSRRPVGCGGILRSRPPFNVQPKNSSNALRYISMVLALAIFPCFEISPHVKLLHWRWYKVASLLDKRRFCHRTRELAL